MIWFSGCNRYGAATLAQASEISLEGEKVDFVFVLENAGPKDQLTIERNDECNSLTKPSLFSTWRRCESREQASLSCILFVPAGISCFCEVAFKIPQSL